MDNAYFGGVEPDQIEGIEIEGRERAIKEGPGPELCGSETGNNDAGELRVVAGKLFATEVLVTDDGNSEEEKKGGEEAKPRHWHLLLR